MKFIEFQKALDSRLELKQTNSGPQIFPIHFEYQSYSTHWFTGEQKQSFIKPVIAGNYSAEL